MKRGVHEGNDFGIVESGGAFELYTADEFAGAKATARIRQARTLKKEENNVAGIQDDREDGVGGAVVGNEADHESVVIVVDHFEGAWETLAHLGKGAAGE